MILIFWYVGDILMVMVDGDILMMMVNGEWYSADLLKLWECSEYEGKCGDQNDSKWDPGEDLRTVKC